MHVFYPRKQSVVNAKKLPNLKDPLGSAGGENGGKYEKNSDYFCDDIDAGVRTWGVHNNDNQPRYKLYVRNNN